MESKDEVKYGSNLFCSVVSVGFIFWETWFPLPTIIIRRYSQSRCRGKRRRCCRHRRGRCRRRHHRHSRHRYSKNRQNDTLQFSSHGENQLGWKNLARTRTRNLFLLRFFVSTWKSIVAINSLGGAFFSSCRQFFEIPRNVSLDVAAIYAVCGFKLGCLNNWH